MNQMSAKVPWVSFCLATYRRPEFLGQTLRCLAQQTMPDFEVIVSDNDPEGSGRAVVEEINDPRFHYFCNEENVGMIKNFNQALGRARGEFVVMITDDDPIYPEMLATLRELSEKYPGYGTYYGACNLEITSAAIGRLYNLQPGTNSLLANLPPGTIRAFSKEQFPAAFFTHQAFPYVLWSTGVVRREIALEIGGTPDYGSPYLGDWAYIVLAGAHSGCVTINTALGCQTIHEGNFGRKEYDQIRIALEGFLSYVSKRLSYRSDWNQIYPLMIKCIGAWAVAHLLFLRSYFKLYNIDDDSLNSSLERIFSLPFMRKYRWKYRLQVYLPSVFQAYLLTRRTMHTIGARRS